MGSTNRTGNTFLRSGKFVWFVPFIFLLCGFFWSKPNWKDIEEFISYHFPSVRHIEQETLRNKLAQKTPIHIIDVREKEEFQVSQIPGAMNLIDPDEVTFSKNDTIIVYCSVGVRSAHFVQELQRHGYNNVFNLRGSIFAWANNGYPLKRNNTNAYKVHPYNKRWGSLLDPQLHLYHLPTTVKP